MFNFSVKLGHYYTAKQNIELSKFRTFRCRCTRADRNDEKRRLESQKPWLVVQQPAFRRVPVSVQGGNVRHTFKKFHSEGAEPLRQQLRQRNYRQTRRTLSRDERAMETEESIISTVIVTTSPLLNCSSCITSTCRCFWCAPNWGDAIVQVPTQFCHHISDHVSINIDLIFKNEIDLRLQK